MYILFVYSGQVVRNPGLRVDGGLKFSLVGKVFSLLIFRGLRACKPSSKVERKKMAEVYKWVTLILA